MKAGVTVREKTTTGPGPDGEYGTADDQTITNALTNSGSAVTAGDPPTQSPDELSFNQKYLFNRNQLEALREFAKTKGTYIQPTSNGQMNLAVTDGLIFVDTVGGVPLGDPPVASTLANVKITGASNSGWIVVMGSLTIDGNVTYNGLIYAVNDLQYRGTGTGGIYGSVVSGNIVDTKSTIVDTQALGNSKIYYDCEKVKNGGGKFKPPEGYFVKSGTWRECDPTRAQGTPGACS
jgi:hypothetical protein